MGNLVTIKISKIGINVDLKKEVQVKARALLETMASFAYATWTQMAQTELKSTSADYIKGLVEPEISGNKATILLTGKFPIMVEEGTASFDMKPGLLEGEQAKPTKDGEGKYVTVPFRHGTPTVTGRNFPPMPKSIHALAQPLAPTVQVSGKVTWGGRLGGTENLFPPKTKPAVGEMTAPYTHVKGVYEDMVRVMKTYAKTPQAQYFTMRRVSTRRVVGGKVKGSDPNSWIHPGLPGAGLLPKVKGEVEKNMKGMARAVGLAVA